MKDTHIPIHAPGSILSVEEMAELLRTMGEVTPDAHLILEYAARPEVTKELLHRDIGHIARLCGVQA